MSPHASRTDAPAGAPAAPAADPGGDGRGRTGLWFVGALGEVAVTACAGLAALRLGLAPPTGMVTALPPLADLPLPSPADLVLGGCDVRSGDPVREAERIAAEGGAIPTALLPQVRDALADYGGRIVPGTLAGAGDAVRAFADGPVPDETAGEAVARLADALRAFRRDHGLRRVVVIHLASVEDRPVDADRLDDPDVFEQEILAGDAPAPPSALYAWAALEAGCAFVNFTPAVGSEIGAVRARAEALGLPLAGRDGKTGETLLKTVLAPMFRMRNLRVRGWAGLNVLGNRDGRVLDEPGPRAAKTADKDAVLDDLLAGDDPDRVTNIHWLPSFGDRKTAVDVVRFEGFLGSPMDLQFTWSACDSALAAPLVLDLGRLAALAMARGESGCLEHLGFFFKSPMTGDPDARPEHALSAQHAALLRWAERVAAG